MGATKVQDHQYLAWVGNSASAATVVGTVLGLLPPLAALVAICWYLIQMYESKTYREWRDRRLLRKKARKIAKLQARQKVIEAELEALEVTRAAQAYADHMVKTANAAASERVQAAKNVAAACSKPEKKDD